MAIALTELLPLVPADGTPPEKTAGWRFHAILLAAAVGLGVSFQLLGPAWSRTVIEQVKLDSLSSVGALLCALLVSMLAHELGHLVAALFLNYELLGGALGPLRLDLWHGKTLFSLEKVNWLRCSISAVPREIHNCWRGRMMLVVASGPFVSLLFLIAATILSVSGHDAKPWEGWAPTFWSSCAEVNFFFVVLGLVPNSNQSQVRNDAALFLSLRRNDAEALDLFTCHQAIELSLRGIRPEYYPEPLLAELTAFRGRPYTNLMVARRMLEWAADSGNLELAQKWDEFTLTASASCSHRVANVALAESACFDLVFREDLHSASYKFAKVDFQELFPPYIAERAWAARLIASDQPHRAPAHILRAQYHLPLGDPYYNYERMLLDKLHTNALATTHRALSAANVG